MAKSRRQQHRRENFNSFANRRLPVFHVNPVPYSSLYLRQVEDRRRFHPEGFYAPAATIGPRWSRSLVVSSLQKRPVQSSTRSSMRSWLPGALPSRLRFKSPERVAVCVRRSIRREVLHAFKKTGRGGQRKPRFSWHSQISCRR